MHPIEHIKTFAKMTPEIEASLRSLMKEKSFRKGDTIRGAFNLTHYSYYIKRGAARVFVTSGGKEHTLSFPSTTNSSSLPSNQSKTIPTQSQYNFSNPQKSYISPTSKSKTSSLTPLQ